MGRAIAVTVALTPHHEHHLLWEGEQPPTREQGFVSETRMPAASLARLRAVKEIASVVRPHVIVAHSSWAGVYTRLSKQIAPVVYAPHGYKFEDLSVTALQRQSVKMVEALLARRSAGTIVLTRREELLANRLRRSAPTYLVPNSPTIHPTATIPATSFATGDTVLMIGRLTAQKDPRHFLDVATAVRSERPDTHFVWAGDGGTNIRRALESEGVEVTGWLAPPQLAEVLSRPALYYHSAAYEGFPLSLLDAAAFEHPVVVRDIAPFRGVRPLATTSAADAPRAILRTLAGGAELQTAIDGSRHIAKTMNATTQRLALDSLFALFESARSSVPA